MNLFEELPDSVIAFVRSTFATANDRATGILSTQPHVHEETLDHQLVFGVSGQSAVLFEKEQVAVAIETHWLGGRRMYGRWEIADIALFVTIRRNGQIEHRKVALLQTKRLYAREISVAEVDDSDYAIGIGRLVDGKPILRPLTAQRSFSFDRDCVYGALAARSQQANRIDEYIREHDIPVFYAFYNPAAVPSKGLYPATSPLRPQPTNELGVRVQTSVETHLALSALASGRSPSLAELELPASRDPSDVNGRYGWRLETFVADEVMRCRQGRLIDIGAEPALQALLYARSAPITGAISITVDVGNDFARPEGFGRFG